VDSQEIGLPVSSNGLVLPCGASGRWEVINS
jgi:23S rRNA (cytosine1962-C5)-methyltransferase